MDSIMVDIMNNRLKHLDKANASYCLQTPTFSNPTSSLGHFSFGQKLKKNWKTIFYMPTVQAETIQNESIYDKNEGFSSQMVTDEEIKAYIRRESGRERLKSAYEVDEDGFFKEEVAIMGKLLITSGVVTFNLASIFVSRNFTKEFRQATRSTKFRSKFEAARQHKNYIVLEVIKSSSLWTARVTCFLTPFLFLSHALSVYRNKSSPLHFGASAAITGGILKASLGIKGVIVGSCFGGLLGLLAGTIFYGLQYSSDLTQDKVHYKEIQEMLQLQRNNIN